MKIFALGDTHLSFDAKGMERKPMGIFGDRWANHSETIRANWLEQVSAEDVVLLPGDISWAMDLQEALVDLAFLADLPGEKIMIRGNHDLWWDSISKVRAILPPKFRAIQNDHVLLGDQVAICGTRGWICEDGGFADAHDEKIYHREVSRLALSLGGVPKEIKHKIVLLHFPPTNWKYETSGFVEVMMAHGVRSCLYGHLHGCAIANSLMGEHWGINFQLVSADYLGFKPKCVYSDEASRYD